MPNIVKPTGMNIIWASAGIKADPGISKASTGWVVELPPYQTANWIEAKQDGFNSHVNQHGVPAWDAETEYQGGLSYTKGSNGILYRAITTSINSDPTNPANSSVWARAFENYGAVQAVQDQLNTHILNYQTLANISNPGAARNNLAVYSKTEGDVRYAFKAGTASQLFSVATPVLPEHAVHKAYLEQALQTATGGIIGVASIQETETGTDANRAVSPAGGQAVYLKKSANLAGLTNVPQARTNLGLGTIATKDEYEYLKADQNFADLTDFNQARANLGLTQTALVQPSYFLQTSKRLSEFVQPGDQAAARANIGCGTAATRPDAYFLQRSLNFSDVENKPLARTNLGLSDSATLPSTTFMRGSNNLNEITNAQAARNKLGLADLATYNAAGISAANGAARLLQFQSLLGPNGWAEQPNGLIIQWGISAVVNQDQGIVQALPRIFPNAMFIAIAVPYNEVINSGSGAAISVAGFERGGFIIRNNHSPAVPTVWIAIGI